MRYSLRDYLWLSLSAAICCAWYVQYLASSKKISDLNGQLKACQQTMQVRVDIEVLQALKKYDSKAAEAYIFEAISKRPVCRLESTEQ